MRDIKFIDHGPPPANKTTGGSAGKAGSHWAGFVLGVLSQQPGRWAVIEVESLQPHYDQMTLKRAAERHGVPFEACIREKQLYARVTA